MIGRVVTLKAPPVRIVSLVPSQTELLFDLGLEGEVAGITKFCVHPESWFRSKPRIGGTKDVRYDRVAALHPDLIIANKEENVEAQVLELEKLCPVWVSDIQTLEDSLQMIREVGTICNRAERALEIAAQITTGFAELHQSAQGKRVAYGIWRDPWMWAGGDTFIHDILLRCGWTNALEVEPRYPAVSLEELTAYNPELVLLSSEPYPFKAKHIEEVKAVLPGAEVILVDGEMFSWYGSRLLHAPAYLERLLQTV
jgi:ABC-type Fe3+-hydroxamate transport system substrate-binding protein